MVSIGNGLQPNGSPEKPTNTNRNNIGYLFIFFSFKVIAQS
ncbi:hypothetical protein ADICYQ_0095 [Cyclobacterium qasimii M12-11B]|uniref:Uncharacterized protein n=1 Tax=Cyclobacterium qasimii M12-11B TaxID=641524 RepID=S7VR40_9BACT|nr:hypothetical protein ADICYQ_0095 [Cyclobacterium qasimii M12-11B]